MSSTQGSIPASPRHLAIALVVLAAFLVTPSLLAQPTPVGAEFRANTTTALDQEDPQVAMDADGDFVAVWSDGDHTTPGVDGSSFGIAAQRYDRDGNSIGGEIVVNTDTLGAQREPAVAMDDDGNFVVVWTDVSSFGGDGDGDLWGIAGQLFDSDGNPVGGQFQVNDVTANQQLRADVEMGPDGGFVAAWADVVGANDFDLSARRFDPSGTPLAGQFQVNTFTTGRQYRSSIDFDANGDFVIAWSSAPGGGQDSALVVRQFDASGNPLSGEIQVTTQTTDGQLTPSLAVTDDGGFVVVWTDAETGTITSRRFDSAGAPTTGEIVLHDDPTSFPSLPEVAIDNQDRLAVTWAKVDLGTGDFDVYAQQFALDGTPAGDAFQVNTFTDGDQGYGFRGPDLAMDSAGNFTVVWQDGDGFNTGQDGDGKGVYGQLFDGGAPVIDPDLVGHWPLDEGDGTSAANNAGNGLDGTLEGDIGWTSGQQGTGIVGDGASGLVRIPDSGVGSPIDVTNALTLALWVRPDHLDGSTQVLVSKDNGYELELGKLGAATWDLRLDNKSIHSAATPLEESIWQHLAMTWDGTTVCSYYNGLLDGCSPFGGVLVPNDEDLGFGARPSVPASGGPVFHFYGAYDEVRVYNRALSDTEIADIVLAELRDIAPPQRFNGSPASSLPAGTTTAIVSLETDEPAYCVWDTTPGLRFDDMGNDFDGSGNTTLHTIDIPVVDGGIYDIYIRCEDDGLENTNGDDLRISFGVGDSDICQGLIGDWRFNFGSGCTVSDLSGGHDATLGPGCPTNAPTWVAGVHGLHAALAFDGVDDEVKVATPTELAGLGQLTFAAWIRHGTSGIFRSILDYRVAGSKGADLYLSAASKAFLRVNDLTLEGNAVVADGQWHHLAGTYDGSDLRIYVDGALDASATVGLTSVDVLAPLYIGRHYANGQNPFAGTLDEVTIHDRALSAIEVLDLATAGVPSCAP